MQLRFASFAVINLRRDLHPQECAHAGRTNKKRSLAAFLFFLARQKAALSAKRQSGLNTNQNKTAPPRDLA
jgi:hypothetical protein